MTRPAEVTTVAYVCADPGIPVFGTKGASVHIQELVRAWRARGAHVEVFAVRRGDEVPADLADLTVHVVPVAKVPADPVSRDGTRVERVTGRERAQQRAAAERERAQQRAAAEIARLVTELGPDVVHERYSLFSTVLGDVRAGLAVRGASVATILEVNAPLIDEQRTHRVLVDETAAHRALDEQLAAADVVACVSEPVADWVQGHRLRAKEKAKAKPQTSDAPNAASLHSRQVHPLSTGLVGAADRDLRKRGGRLGKPVESRSEPVESLSEPGDSSDDPGGRAPSAGGPRESAVVVTPNGVNTDRITAVTPDLSEAPVVVFVGTLKPWHGVEDLLQAAALAERPWRLRIVGDGPQRQVVEELATTCGRPVELVGAVAPEQVPATLEGALVAVAPYPVSDDHYFSPLKVYEYAAAALPVVASRIGQIPEVVQHGRTGLLVPPSDPAALAAAIDTLVADPARAQQMGRTGRALMVDRHSWHAVLEATLAPLGQPGDLHPDLAPATDAPAGATAYLGGARGVA